MTDYQARVDGTELQPAAGWRLDWVDRGRGIARLTDGQASRPVVVEGRGSEWFVTLPGAAYRSACRPGGAAAG